MALNFKSAIISPQGSATITLSQSPLHSRLLIERTLPNRGQDHLSFQKGRVTERFSMTTVNGITRIAGKRTTSSQQRSDLGFVSEKVAHERDRAVVDYLASKYKQWLSEHRDAIVDAIADRFPHDPASARVITDLLDADRLLLEDTRLLIGVGPNFVRNANIPPGVSRVASILDRVDRAASQALYGHR